MVKFTRKACCSPSLACRRRPAGAARRLHYRQMLWLAATMPHEYSNM